MLGNDQRPGRLSVLYGEAVIPDAHCLFQGFIGGPAAWLTMRRIWRDTVVLYKTEMAGRLSGLTLISRQINRTTQQQIVEHHTISLQSCPASLAAFVPATSPRE